ncbi:hypothetical protein KCV87_24370 [Actinosynnema pretiosum subsp. pretiosum]|uniref:Uncharacterized protein n=1 Tax=Actinosynnema pretiosum subsp. pretiosum TaxID=103721 RepID=A0AA45L3D0_9PSEU|nr:hypothetical protein APASM_6271 [Actinosynnema pretiosum subsp. pretiosum]QUF02577.1 hypothetical protein KCV87_24370 [Actinosynnema pretiosum subsp. pretiosum]
MTWLRELQGYGGLERARDAWGGQGCPGAVLEHLRLVRVVAEAVDGRRPLGQVRAVLTGSAAREVGRLLSPGTSGTAVGGLRMCRVSERAAEIAGTLRRGARVRALAARAELVEGRWLLSRFHLLP